MLRGEGKAGERWKTTIGLISNIARAAHFFVHFFAVVWIARLQRETSRNVLEPVYMEEWDPR